MKLSELIINLTTQLSTHGDNEVIIEHNPKNTLTNFHEIDNIEIFEPKNEKSKYILIKS